MLTQNLLLAGDDAYNLSKSLRFRQSASAYLSRTPSSAGSLTTWTYSVWVKRGSPATNSGNYQSFLSYSPGGSSEDLLSFGALNDEKIYFYVYTSGYVGQLVTTQYFRDYSSWYHLVFVWDTTQATSSNRMKVYVNGVQVTAFATANYPAQNATSNINTAGLTYIGRYGNSNAYTDSYMAEANFINGQALTPSSFGETDVLTGVWKPKKYAGTYGTNGFYLPFTDVATTSGSNAGLGKDFSGNGNYWNTNNISVTTGTTYDSMTDVPTLTSATVANYCVFNPLDRGSTNFTLSNGNLTISGASASSATRATMAVSSGKWYWEATPTAIGNGLGVGFAGDSSRFNPATWNAGTYVIYQSDGNKHINGSASAYGATYTTSDVIGIALDMDAGTITFYKNNTSQGTASTGLTGVYLPVFSQTSGATTGTINANFGAGSGFTYTPPTGFVALNTYNLPTSTIVKGNTVMDATLYTGTLLSNAVTNTAGFKPDLVWIKSRSAATNHKLTDSVRGTTKALSSNTTTSEATDTQGLTAFGTGGFTVGTNTDYNNLAATYVGWQWQAGQGSTSSNTSGSITSTVSVNATAGFSVVTYTGNGTDGASIGHGLGVAPSMIIVKNRTDSTSSFWCVYHKSAYVSAADPNVLYLNSTQAQTDDTNVWGSAPAFTSSTFKVGDYNGSNGSGKNLVAYCWSEIAGFSKFGSYTGNGSADGPFVYLGFRPKYIMIKSTVETSNWFVYDTARNTYNAINSLLFPSDSGAEYTDTGYALDALSNGFKIRATGTYGGYNNNGNAYIYACFAENPFKNALAR